MKWAGTQATNLADFLAALHPPEGLGLTEFRAVDHGCVPPSLFSRRRPHSISIGGWV